MSEEPYLIALAARLGAADLGFDDARREKHRAFVLSHQMPDGGFRGREGDSDLYYTSFAVRCLAMLGGLTDEQADQLGRYSRTHLDQQLNVIDLVSWMYTALVVQLAGGPDLLAGRAAEFSGQVAETLETTRTEEGGYAKTEEGSAGSTYHSFLVGLIYELIGQPIPRPNALVQFLYDRQRDDGGFVEIAPMKRSGTNPTAAAVALLRMLGHVDDEIRADVRAFLSEVRTPEGGFQANTRIGFPDGLSTFTGLLTAQDLGIADLMSPTRVRNFIANELEFPTGGFRGAAWDNAADVEYTFYGLGTLALCATTT